MGRLPRRNLGAGVYHIYNRCANNLWILDSPECKDKFLELLERLSGKYELNIYHYCVMRNHFHIAAEGSIKNISSFVSGLSSQYSKFYHKISQNGFGPVWQGRFKSVIVQKSVYLSRLGRYIELNPVRAGIIDPANIVDYSWGSARFYLTDKKSPVIFPEKHPLWQPPFDEKFRQNYAEYGSKIICKLSDKLTMLYGKGFDRSTLYKFVRFYKFFPQIVDSASPKLERVVLDALSCAVASQ